jgi:fatty acid/phospholipid synthesis protein PlsX
MRIAVDAMGGDHAPDAQVEGAVRAANELDVTVVLVGDKLTLEEKLEKYEYDAGKIEILHTTQVIENDESPLAAIKHKKDSSMVVGAQKLSHGEVDAFVSAGSTGALLGVATLIVKRIDGIERPALAPLLPSDTVPWLLVDAGANANCRPNYLKQFAIMGSIYMKNAMGVENPRVALVNIGTEEHKGNDLVKAASLLLEKAPINFIGNIEARDIPLGAADVVVCDGFVGNVILKLTEGLAKMFMHGLKDIFYRNTFTKMCALGVKKGVGEFRQKTDYTEHGGALLLGTKRPVIKAHGSSNAKAMFFAISQAKKFVQTGVTETIMNEIAITQEGAIDEN